MFFLPEARGACLADEAGEVSTKVSLLHPRESEISDLLSRKKAPFSETERKEAIFSMPGDKAPGPDLMGCRLYFTRFSGKGMSFWLSILSLSARVVKLKKKGALSW